MPGSIIFIAPVAMVIRDLMKEAHERRASPAGATGSISVSLPQFRRVLPASEPIFSRYRFWGDVSHPGEVVRAFVW